MPCSRLMWWIGVPGGSTFELSVEESDAKYKISGTLTENDDPPRSLERGDLVPAFQQALSTPNVYSLTLYITFLGANTTTTINFKGVVTKPDGTQYWGDRCYEASGKVGETDIVIVSILTKKP